MSILWIRFIEYNYWVLAGCFDRINVSMKRASTMFSLTHSEIKGLQRHIVPKWLCSSALQPKWQMTCTLPHPINEHQQSSNDFWHCIMENPQGCMATLTHNQNIFRLSRQKWLRQRPYNVLQMSVNGVSTSCGLASWKIERLCGDINP